ncbi:hypothetical protein LXA43DRAFT_1068386 [Ganoderma leucocontextum]|nr:hypothetical protein LXA43DRAFT_1068386 [Ganoderma leucocontextum]
MSNLLALSRSQAVRVALWPRVGAAALGPGNATAASDRCTPFPLNSWAKFSSGFALVPRAMISQEMLVDVQEGRPLEDHEKALSHTGINTNTAPVLLIPDAAVRTRKSVSFDIPGDTSDTRLYATQLEAKHDDLDMGTISDSERGFTEKSSASLHNACIESTTVQASSHLASTIIRGDGTGERQRSAPITNAQPSYLEPEQWKLYRRNHFAQWYHSSGDKPVSAPYNIDPLWKHQPGDLFVHSIEGSANAIQIWVFGADDNRTTWMPVHKPSTLHHPSFPELVLSYSLEDKHPKWIVQNTKRREKGQMFAIYVNM